ncbi:MAG: hypothetical protein GX610_08205 [Rhodococcus sp.]|uniref:hypothetical protein n=1 Tax=unclassified Rhodococcus (in: high G+C Gram-positive bacteria) TaxID=192944 RepID=UPI00146C2345|nr:MULTISPECIES: hypothetical protein [unclassified Rhodococcus (in: high G+C Gram-positive bacteria)]MCK0091289.1 hypothetical protein [Rhodococcus sp. F64268]NLE79555.1 hypothetical protein [Rhodococcus sp. (in: high G+C Gram-positive bacteria)]NLU63841.1 hypothetical protein [Rhodococcus sp. HNM0563]
MFELIGMIIVVACVAVVVACCLILLVASTIGPHFLLASDKKNAEVERNTPARV